MTIDPRDHDCPGGCGAPVRRQLFACQACWRRLPTELRAPIIDAAWGGHAGQHGAAMSTARRWFAVNR